MPRRAERLPGDVRRFAPAVRRVHRAVAVLMGLCVASAACLYVPQLETLVAHRYLVEQVHVYAGVALPVPVLLGLLSPDVRADLRRLERFAPSDWQWLRRRDRRTGGLRVGKFNGGQKLNGALSAGAVLVLLGTGLLMRFTGLVRLTLRTGATFVHDWTALGLVLLLLGHLWHASRDPYALRGMRTGDVPLRWARERHAAWADEVAGPVSPAP